ncbi:hypothetical protein HPB49_007668 [Dermacentor silvarum]|uniref:Uncharacterized protein n=1 Tax=Dermacentor silvarum TaxID=543639 RepID=A0ACB8CQF8_DERSI|nr:hypothetical protein HPB49_007668 [Dermacentor silvarum]
MLNAGISRLRGRAAAWHRTDGVSLKSWTTWVAALRKEFDKQPLFCEWVENVNARRHEDETITDYMYCRLQPIKRGKYALSDDDIVDWLIQGVRLESARPVLAAFHDLRKGSVSEFINYARQFDRRMASTRSDGTHAKTSPRNEPRKKKKKKKIREMITSKASPRDLPRTFALAACNGATARRIARDPTHELRRRR